MELILEDICEKCHKFFSVNVTKNLTAEVTDYGYPYGVEKKIEVEFHCPHCNEYICDYLPYG